MGKVIFYKWLDKLKTFLQLQKLSGDTSEYIPYFLEGDAYELYTQLDDNGKQSGKKLEEILKKSFGIDSFEAFEMLQDKRWDISESVEVYFAGIRNARTLASLCAIESQEFIIHSFITGLPEDTATRCLRTQVQVSNLSLTQIDETAKF